MDEQNYISEDELAYEDEFVLDEQDDEDIAQLVYHAEIYALAIESGLSEDEADYLMHYGRPHEGSIPHSGRYAWGSGDDPYQGLAKFQATVHRLEAAGMKEKDIYKHMGFPNSQAYRARKAVAKAELRKYRQNTVTAFLIKQWMQLKSKLSSMVTLMLVKAQNYI